MCQKMSISKATLILTNFMLWLYIGLSIPPEEPIKCSTKPNKCTITNSIGIFPDRTICKAGDATYPRNEQELIKAISEATMNRRKMKVTTRYSHSIPKLVCPDGDEGLLISTNNLNRIVDVDKLSMTMTIESGVTLKKLIKEAAKVGLMLPHSPYWSGLTIGGLLSTGSHGSSLWGKGSAVHEYVTEIRLVSPGSPQEGYVTIRNLNASDQDLDAVKVSLGVLGVISQVKMQLEPIFKRSITYEAKNDHDLADKLVSFGMQHEFADLTWYPSQQKVIYRIDDRVPFDVSGEGRYENTALHSASQATIEDFATTEKKLESTKDALGKCQFSKKLTSSLHMSAYGLTNNGINFTGYPVIGYQYELQSSSSCLDSEEDAIDTYCQWDPRVEGQLYHYTSLSVALSNANSFLEDLKKLFSLNPESTCGIDLYIGILLRFVKASSAYLGKQEDAIEFDIMYYRSRDPMIPRLYEDVFEEFEQMAIFKYGALPHWGKNRNVAFEGVIRKFKKADEFLGVKEKYDPMSLFSNQWTNKILGLQGEVTINHDGCALEGLCVCSKDTHCAPDKGYFCRPGKVYKEARVCTLTMYDKHTEL
ncbi:hypothetical protein V2J09_008487 [Rumex salicifolius]